MNTWKEECVYILDALGGHAYLPDIYSKFLEIHTREVTPNYKASIRDALERGCPESDKYDEKTALFFMIDGKNKGHYGLIHPNSNTIDLTIDEDEFSEGKRRLRAHLIRERNQHLITKAKQQFKASHNGRLFCEVCGFDFSEQYGELGNDFIEAHHIKPVSQMLENEKTRIEDIVMLCSNCHSMIHRRKPWIDKENLRSLIKRQTNRASE